MSLKHSPKNTQNIHSYADVDAVEGGLAANEIPYLYLVNTTTTKSLRIKNLRSTVAILLFLLFLVLLLLLCFFQPWKNFFTFQHTYRNKNKKKKKKQFCRDFLRLYIVVVSAKQSSTKNNIQTFTTALRQVGGKLSKQQKKFTLANVA